jgi:hypothetical protein
MMQFIAWLSKRKTDAEDAVTLHDALWRQRIKAHLDEMQERRFEGSDFRDGWDSAIIEIAARLEIE